jgi:putative ABC transport system ATP-binding protein
MAILQHLNARGATIVLVTHEPDIAAFCSRVLTFRDGTLQDDRRVAQAASAAAVLAAMPPPEIQAA